MRQTLKPLSSEYCQFHFVSKSWQLFDLGLKISFLPFNGYEFNVFIPNSMYFEKIYF